MVSGVQNGHWRSATRYGAAMGISTFGLTTEGRAAGVRVHCCAASSRWPSRGSRAERHSQRLLGLTELYHETWAFSPTMRSGILGARRRKGRAKSAGPISWGMRQTGAASMVCPLNTKGQPHCRAGPGRRQGAHRKGRAAPEWDRAVRPVAWVPLRGDNQAQYRENPAPRHDANGLRQFRIIGQPRHRKELARDDAVRAWTRR